MSNENMSSTRSVSSLGFKIPKVEGQLSYDYPLSKLTWLRTGGPAQLLFQPSDPQDLKSFLQAIDPNVPLFVLGVGSNLIVRDGGIKGVVIRLGRGFNQIEFNGNHVHAGAAGLDAHVARKAAAEGLDLTFLRTIPGSIGGAVRMNAGCYGSYVADHLLKVKLMMRDGGTKWIAAQDLKFGYRQSHLPEGAIVLEAVFKAPSGAPKALEARMEEQLRRRDESQPTKERSAGSTFRNPAGYSSTGKANDDHSLKAWKVIETAGLRGFKIGDAQMSEKHPNFMINCGAATAQELEELGEYVKKRVFETQKIRLEWEIMRVGQPLR